MKDNVRIPMSFYFCGKHVGIKKGKEGLWSDLFKKINIMP